MKAKRDFNSLALRKSFKKGDTLTEDPKLMAEWERQGMAEGVKESKPATVRKTKELKAKKATK
tara:strand:+ start:1434 stop:1622 length:189 start_codon:yes stop_codon:yes gene_type:complete